MTARIRLILTWAAMAAVGVLTLVASGTDTVHATTFAPTLDVSVADPTPGAPSDVIANFDLPDGDVNFAAVVSFIPPEWGVVKGADIPIGMKTGELDALSQLGLANSACNQVLPVSFDMLNASINTTDTVSFDDTEFDEATLDPNLSTGEKTLKEYEESHDVGTTGDFADDIEYVTQEGDTIQSVSELLGIPEEDLIAINFLDANEPNLEPGTVIGNGIFDGIDMYPDFLNRVFKDADGNIIQPLRRSAGVTPVAGIPVFLEFLIFPPGTELPTRGQGTLPSDEALGYPSVTVLQSIGDPDAKPEPSIINDFCTPLETVNTTFGKDETTGTQFLVNPGDAPYTWTTYAFGQRDADGDSYENSLDTCPLDPNVGNPRIVSDGDADGDGLDTICDPNDVVGTTGAANSDQDADGYSNRNDNCTMKANGEEEDNQKDTDLDQIGDACDPHADTPDGDLSSAEPTAEVKIGAGTGTPTAPTSAQCPNCFVSGPIPTNPPHRGDNASGSASAGATTPAGGSGSPTVTTPPNGTDDGGGSGTTIAIVVGVIAAVVIIGGGAFLVMRRRGG